MTQAQQTIRIMPLGDSNTEGYPQMQGGYRVQLWNRLALNSMPVEMVGSMTDAFEWAQPHHEGHSGWTISDIDAQVTGWLNTSQPDIVLLMIGTNDILTNQYDLMVTRFEMLIDKIFTTRPAVHLVVAQILPIAGEPANTQARTFNATLIPVIRARAEQGKKITYVDMNTPFTFADLVDGVHPTVEAANHMGDIWYESVKKIITDPFHQLTPITNESVQSSQIEFTWTQGAIDEQYKLKIKSLTGAYKFTQAGASCENGVCRTTPDFTSNPLPYEAQLKWKIVGNNRKTSWQPFSTKIPAPELLHPLPDTQINTLTPDFSWAALPDAQSYTLIVDQLTSGGKNRLVKHTFDIASVPSLSQICAGGICAVNLGTLGIALAGEGNYRWRVKTAGIYGTSRSIKATFTVVQPATSLLPLPEQ